MGPPLSPRETRRSGRRSAPSVSASTSKSPDSDQPPRQKDTSRGPSSSTGSGGRNKRLKQEDYEEPPDERKNFPASSASSSVSNSISKAKRKVKDKDKEKDKQESNVNSGDQDVPSVENQVQDPPEEEEQGITRCVCGSAGTLYVLSPVRRLTCFLSCRYRG